MAISQSQAYLVLKHLNEDEDNEGDMQDDLTISREEDFRHEEKGNTKRQPQQR